MFLLVLGVSEDHVVEIMRTDVLNVVLKALVDLIYYLSEFSTGRVKINTV